MPLRVVIGLLALAVPVAGCGAPAQAERQLAIAAAKAVYGRAESRGVDFRSGPCIAEKLPGLRRWVADVAHDPRQPVDDNPRYQCRRYRAGAASHFVELTPGGELIRAE